MCILAIGGLAVSGYIDLATARGAQMERTKGIDAETVRSVRIRLLVQLVKLL